LRAAGLPLAVIADICFAGGSEVLDDAGLSPLFVLLWQAVVVAAVVVGFVAIGLLVGNPSSTSGAIQRDVPKPTPTVPTHPAGHTITSPVAPPPSSNPPSNLPTLHCSKPPPLPSKPQQFAKPPSAS